MSANGLVTLMIDDRQVQVPAGTGLVETAAAAGIEIPVFCYEPRLGAPVGACRMCLVEIEGIPKPQAGCTLTAQDGMVVKTAKTSELAAAAQNSTLEFILVNHPLDCPVCDKGGECPLQDLTFRYGPGSTRMTFDKRTFEKPIPISPTIALDRERCILCYRCTRFSEDVAEDGQLIARDRGALSQIATYEDLPYRAPFSGNVVELCPVGALTSTLYRFEARPWEIVNVPTVCGLCPVGCNVSATYREGQVRRVSSRNHPEIDRGWICDKGRFTYPALRAPDRVTAPGIRVPGTWRFAEASWDEALDELERLARAAGDSVVLALSGSETVEIASALSQLVRKGFGSHRVVLPEETSTALDSFRAPLSAIADAELVVVIGDDPVAERAPIVDLWIRQARRNGAEVLTFGPAGQRPAPTRRRRRGRRGARRQAEGARQAAPRGRARGTHLVGPGRPRRRRARAARGSAGARRQARQRRVLPARHAERARRRRRLGGRGRGRGDSAGTRRPAAHLGRGGGRRPARPGARGAKRRRCRRDDVLRVGPRLDARRPAGHELSRARRHDGQPRRPRAAAAEGERAAGPRRPRLDRRARRALRRHAGALRAR